MPMTDNNLIEYYSKFTEKERLTDELKDFLEKRLNFLKDETNENSVLMKMAYDKIYTSTKHLWVSGIIRDEDFWMLKRELSNIDRET